MKRTMFLAAAALAVALIATSCGASKAQAGSAAPGAAETSPTAPVVDASKGPSIDKQLDAYADLVDRYLADKASPDKKDLGAYEKELADLGGKMSQLAVDFSETQLARYNEITAKLDN